MQIGGLVHRKAHVGLLGGDILEGFHAVLLGPFLGHEIMHDELVVQHHDEEELALERHREGRLALVGVGDFGGGAVEGEIGLAGSHVQDAAGGAAGLVGGVRARIGLAHDAVDGFGDHFHVARGGAAIDAVADRLLVIEIRPGGACEPPCAQREGQRRRRNHSTSRTDHDKLLLFPHGRLLGRSRVGKLGAGAGGVKRPPAVNQRV